MPLNLGSQFVFWGGAHPHRRPCCQGLKYITNRWTVFPVARIAAEPARPDLIQHGKDCLMAAGRVQHRRGWNGWIRHAASHRPMAADHVCTCGKGPLRDRSARYEGDHGRSCLVRHGAEPPAHVGATTDPPHEDLPVAPAHRDRPGHDVPFTALLPDRPNETRPSQEFEAIATPKNDALRRRSNVVPPRQADATHEQRPVVPVRHRCIVPRTARLRPLASRPAPICRSGSLRRSQRPR